MKNVLLVGTLPPPVTGEANVNISVADYLATRCRLSRVNSNIASGIATPGGMALGKMLSVLVVYWNCLRQFIGTRFDVVYMVSGQTLAGLIRALPIILLARIRADSLVVHFHGSLAAKSLCSAPRILKYVIRKLYRNVNLIVLSEILKSEHEQAFQCNVEVLENFVPSVVQRGVLRDDKIEGEGTVELLFFSNLIEQKGVFDAIDATKELLRRGLDVRLRLCGLVSQENSEIINNRISGINQIQLIGQVLGVEKESILQGAHVFILPTYYPIEGMPISMLEAASAGLIVVASNQGAISDFLIDGLTGYQCKVRDSVGLADLVESIIANRGGQREVVRSAYARLTEKFSPEKFFIGISRIIGV